MHWFEKCDCESSRVWTPSNFEVVKEVAVNEIVIHAVALLLLVVVKIISSAQ